MLKMYYIGLNQFDSEVFKYQLFHVKEFVFKTRSIVSLKISNITILL